MEPSVRAAFDATRDFSKTGFRSGCYAPFVSLYFNTIGEVNACCRNQTYSLGNVARNRLDEIWNGPAINLMRDALESYQFGEGCEFCEWMIAARDYEGAITHLFEDFEVPERRPRWPKGMEFAISNTCNYECIQCCGDWSSLIRTKREGLPALAQVYSDQFFDDLRRYLPHLTQAKFYGGEPFLARENFRIWDMMIEDGLHPSCHALTNGSQWNEKVERVLSNLTFSIGVSIDGITKKTFEAIRVNGNFERVMENMTRFRDYSRRVGTQMMVSFSLMPQNWFELGDMLLHCEEMGYEINVIRVIDPPKFSLFNLPATELQSIVAQMERQATTLLPRLKRLRDVFTGVIESLRENSRDRQKEGYRNVMSVNAQMRRDHVAEATDLMQRSLWREAIEAASQTPREHKNFFHALFLCAHALRRMGDLEGADRKVEEAMNLTRRNAGLFVERAWLRLAQGRFAEGIADARHARSMLPPAQDEAETHVLQILGPLLAAAGERDEARVVADRSIVLAENRGPQRHADALLDAARLHRQLKDFASSERDLARALALQPDRVDLHVERAWLHFEKGEMGPGYEAARRAHELDASNGSLPALSVSHALGVLSSEVGRHQEAIVHLERYLATQSIPDEWTRKRLETVRKSLALK